MVFKRGPHGSVAKANGPSAGEKRTRKVPENVQAARAQTRAAKAQFDAAHRKGMAAIKTRDTDTLDEAIREEGKAVDRLFVEHRGAKRR